MLFARSHRYEEAGIALKNETHLVGDEGLEVQRRVHVALAACGSAAMLAMAFGSERDPSVALAMWGGASGAALFAVLLIASFWSVDAISGELNKGFTLDN